MVPASEAPNGKAETMAKCSPKAITGAAVALVVFAAFGCGKKSEEEAVRLRAEAADWRVKYEALSAESAAGEKELASLRRQVAELSAELDSAKADLKAALAKMSEPAASHVEQPPQPAIQPSAAPAAGDQTQRTAEARQRLEELGALLFERDQFNIALPVLQSALDLGSDGPETLYRIAYCRASLGQYEEAAESYQRALERLQAEPAKNADLLKKCLNNYGVTELKLDKPEQASELFRKAAAADERYAPAYFNLGVVYADHLNRPAEAIEALRKHIIYGGERSASARDLIARLQAGQAPPKASPAAPPEAPH